MDALLVSVGSHGDLHPFIGLGLALRARGHRVTLISKEECAALIRGAGLEFLPLELGMSKQECARGQGLAGRLMKLVGPRWRKLARASTIVPLLRPVYQAIARRYVPGHTVVVASGAALGARIAHDKLGVPLATVHLSPIVFRSAQRAPVQPPLVLPDWLPRWSRSAAYWLLDRLVLDRLLAGPLNAYRTELGLPPVRRVLDAWRHSPQCVIGLFPEWFAPPLPEWPAATRLTGFPLFDGAASAILPQEICDFVVGGLPPVVVTPGTSIRTGGRFLQESMAACQLLDQRGLVLTRFRDQLPGHLPANFLHCDYVPFSGVLPHAAALIHCGGIGSAAQALAAGVPQVIMPIKNDQFENARRLEDLGVAVVLKSRDYRAEAVARALEHLLGSRTVAHQCRTLAAKLRETSALDDTCRLIEELHAGASARSTQAA